MRLLPVCLSACLPVALSLAAPEAVAHSGATVRAQPAEGLILRNDGAGGFEASTLRVLRAESMDAAAGSVLASEGARARRPVFFDVGGDGLLDLVVPDASPKAIAAGEDAQPAWSTATAGILDWSSQSCSGECSGSTCYPDDIMEGVNIDAATAANAWQVDDAVYIRILRDTSVTDNLASGFALLQVQLTYPTNE